MRHRASSRVRPAALRRFWPACTDHHPRRRCRLRSAGCRHREVRRGPESPRIFPIRHRQIRFGVCAGRRWRRRIQSGSASCRRRVRARPQEARRSRSERAHPFRRAGARLTRAGRGSGEPGRRRLRRQAVRYPLARGRCIRPIRPAPIEATDRSRSSAAAKSHRGPAARSPLPAARRTVAPRTGAPRTGAQKEAAPTTPRSFALARTSPLRRVDAPDYCFLAVRPSNSPPISPP